MLITAWICWSADNALSLEKTFKVRTRSKDIYSGWHQRDTVRDWISHSAWETGGDIRAMNQVGSDRAVSKRVCLSSNIQPFNSARFPALPAESLRKKNKKKTKRITFLFTTSYAISTGSEFYLETITCVIVWNKLSHSVHKTVFLAVFRTPTGLDFHAVM